MDVIKKYYLTEKDLDNRIDDTDSNDQEMVRFSKTKNKFIFPECDKCKLPKIIHIDKDLQKCDANPTEEDLIAISELKNYLRNNPRLAKFKRLEVSQFQRFLKSTSVSAEETDRLQVENDNDVQEILVVTEEHDSPTIHGAEQEIFRLKNLMKTFDKDKKGDKEQILK